ncbi:PTS transporter subunit EIIC [Clostridium sp.]|uniref:PTS transporter subunit EIIC n=1 Tax=Clostridium sp. TaxID=1506 RepID=UPI003F34D023
MRIKDFIMDKLSSLGKAMLIPIVAMPLAGLLSRLGEPDLLNMPMLKVLSSVVFGNLDLLFVIGVTIAYANVKDKSIAILSSILSLMVFKEALLYINKDINMGVFAGILVGAVSTGIFNKVKDIKVPELFNFFGGEKLNIIISPLTIILFAYLASYIWPIIKEWIDVISIVIGASGAIGIFIFGFLNRMLIPIGLHHVINLYIFYELGTFSTENGVLVTGEFSRFLAGDKTAGAFLVMFFVIMIFGLPGAAYAMYKVSNNENKEKTKGLMMTGSLNSIVVGITEQIEFSFMFNSPKLYFIHAIYTGLAGVILYLLNCRLGFSFGFNVIDLTLNWKMGTNTIWIIPVGILFFFLYYFTFKYIIVKEDISTPGRNSNVNNNSNLENHEKIKLYSLNIIEYIGGVDNIQRLSTCATRLRIGIKDESLLKEKLINDISEIKAIKISNRNIQVYLGQDAVYVAKYIENNF